MATQQEQLCPHCNKPFTARRKLTFLGFPKYVCPECKKALLKPLGRGTRVFYWIFAGTAVLLSVWYTVSGRGFAIPGILAICAIFGLLEDAHLRRKA